MVPILEPLGTKNPAELLEQMRRNPRDVRFADACKVATHFFGEPRLGKGSHTTIWKMPWAGDPRINLQRGSAGKAKVYQVEQLLKAVDRLNADSAKKFEMKGSKKKK